MQKINIQKLIYTFRHKYLTFNNVVIAVAFLIAASWVWGSLQVMQRNFALQKEVDQKQRLLELTQLQKDSLELQKRYYQTDEYKELAARETLGLVMPGEKLIILPLRLPVQDGSGMASAPRLPPHHASHRPGPGHHRSVTTDHPHPVRPSSALAVLQQ